MQKNTHMLLPAFRILWPLAILVGGIVIGWSLRELSIAPSLQKLHGEGQPVAPIAGGAAGHHPTFHCAEFTAPVEKQGRMSIEQLTSRSDGDTVSVRVRIMNVYPDIMGTNWYHLCDKLNGRVLVAETRQLVHPGIDISISGTLRQNAQIGGAYNFPLFLEDAAIEGVPKPKAAPTDSTTL